ncbi:MAG: chorismate synthase [Butyrivibrio sp.]|uniref:chorismate synthase n=1 Tax=Butyrivibrio sp. TaxID=28121 RepID=UPI0025E1FEEA|nr:chorismate synthase [Butyrivibrio sp.]MCR5770161.1 chorismate synthase [Butyrivibrio sp.]
MSGSTYGNHLKITTWGESHGPALGVVIDGFPAGMELSEADIQEYLDRRKPGTSSVTTPRKEDDKVEILSGVFEGRTTGTPISLMIRNTSQKSADYSQIASYYRPGHADFGFDQKYGFRDYRGGGRSSGRETIGRVAAGALCSKLLKQMGITLTAYTKSIGPVSIDPERFDSSIIKDNPVCMPDADAAAKAYDYIQECRKELDSVGGVIECKIDGVPAGIGDPVFDKLDASMAKALMSIGAVKAVEVGDGVLVSKYKGSEDNDGFTSKDGKITTTTNHSGGIIGGISNGSQIILRCHVKPTPSISKEQSTVKQDGSPIDIVIGGRHDPVVVPRAVVVVECMAAITLLDAMISNMASRADYITDFYKNI